MGKKLIIKGADFSENGFSLSAREFAVKGTYIKDGTYFTNLSYRGMIVINASDATVPFSSGSAYSAIEIPSGATSAKLLCNQKAAVALSGRVEGVLTRFFDSGFKNANVEISIDLTAYPNAFYFCISLENIGNVEVENISWQLTFE